MVSVLLFLAVWCVIDSGYVYGNTEYNNLNVTRTACYERDSCRFILRQPAFWRQRRDSFLTRNCECDRRCPEYGDCCVDYRIRTTTSQAAIKRKNFQMKCIISDLGMNLGAYAIAECPTGYDGSQLIQTKCLTANNIDDPLTVTPVTDPNTKLTYKNRYCAECNNANPNLLLTWIIRLNCDGLPSPETVNISLIWDNISYNSTLESWIVGVKQDVQHKCKLEFRLPPYLYKRVRFCRPNIISSCPNNWDDNIIQETCESYMSVRMSKDGRLYKNPQCAFCNNLDLEDISCNIVKNSETTASLLLSLDVNNSRDHLTYQNGNSSGSCPLQHIYDPFSKQCRNLRRFDTNLQTPIVKLTNKI